MSIFSVMSSDLPAPHPPPAAAVLSLEAALVDRVRRGDAGAFREIFRQHCPRVRRLLRDLLGTDPAADEAAQETFVRAHASLTSGASVDALGPWLLGVARNVSREHLRARSRTVPMADPVDDDAPSASLDPEALLAGREADAALTHALSRLSHDRRAALLLRADHDLSYDDIAALLGWSLPRVKNEIHRARLQLRAALADHLAPSEHRHGT